MKASRGCEVRTQDEVAGLAGWQGHLGGGLLPGPDGREVPDLSLGAAQRGKGPSRGGAGDRLPQGATAAAGARRGVVDLFHPGVRRLCGDDGGAFADHLPAAAKVAQAVVKQVPRHRRGTVQGGP